MVRTEENLEDFLINEAKIYREKISHFVAKILRKSEERKMLEEILSTLINNNYLIRDNNNDWQTNVLDKGLYCKKSLVEK